MHHCIPKYDKILCNKNFTYVLLKGKRCFVFVFPFLVLQETYPHFRNTKLVYIEAQSRHLKSLHFPTTDNWRNYRVFIAGHIGLVDSFLSSCLKELANTGERSEGPTEMLLSSELQRSPMHLGLACTAGARQALPTRNRNEIKCNASFKYMF